MKMWFRMLWWRIKGWHISLWCAKKWFDYGGGRLRFYERLAYCRGVELQAHIIRHEQSLLETGERIQELLKQVEYLRAQLMNVRVSQAALPRCGWEVMAYIPQEIADWLNAHPDRVKEYSTLVAEMLVDYAMKGLLHVNSQGRVNALVFEPVNMRDKPRAPRWVMAVFEKDDRLKFSEKAKLIEPGDERKRIMDASR